MTGAREARRTIGGDGLAIRVTYAIAVGIVAGYVVGIAQPELRQVRQLEQEISGLDAERAAAAASDPNPKSIQLVPQKRPARGKQLRARELVPEISLVGRQSGLRIRAIKQVTDKAEEGQRQVRIVAQGGFTALLAFLQGLEGALPQGQLDELTLRHLAGTTEVELESVLRVRVLEPPANGADYRREGD